VEGYGGAREAERQWEFPHFDQSLSLVLPKVLFSDCSNKRLISDKKNLLGNKQAFFCPNQNHSPKESKTYTY